LMGLLLGVNLNATFCLKKLLFSSVRSKSQIIDERYKLPSSFIYASKVSNIIRFIGINTLVVNILGNVN